MSITNILSNTIRSSHWRCSVKGGVLRNIAKLTGKHLCQSLFFNKVAGLRHRHACFPVSFAKFLRTLFLENTSGRLLLHIKNVTPTLTYEIWIKLFIYHLLLRIHQCFRFILIILLFCSNGSRIAQRKKTIGTKEWNELCGVSQINFHRQRHVQRKHKNANRRENLKTKFITSIQERNLYSVYWNFTSYQ